MSMSTWYRLWSFSLDNGEYWIRLAWENLHPIYLVRSFYLVCIIAILTTRLLSPLRQRFLAYGARTQHKKYATEKFEKSKITQNSLRPLDLLASIDVPHGWFTHFYILSLASSCLWIWLLCSSDSILPLAKHQRSTLISLQSPQSALLCATLMLIQSARRLVECVVFLRSSTSRMWVGHYAFGHAFYFFTNIAVWVESTKFEPDKSPIFGSKAIDAPSLKTLAGVAMFILASGMQLISHSYLAKLKKYTLPTQGLFPWLIAPHYTAECVIYLSLAMLGAPDYQIFNRTLLCTTVLTAVNLGITAGGTKQWMFDKFREQSSEVKRRWCLIPGIW